MPNINIIQHWYLTMKDEKIMTDLIIDIQICVVYKLTFMSTMLFD